MRERGCAVLRQIVCHVLWLVHRRDVLRHHPVGSEPNVQRLAHGVRLVGEAAVAQVFRKEDGIASLDFQTDHARFLVRVATIGARQIRFVRARHHAKRPLLIAAVAYEIDHPHHHTVDARLSKAVAIFLIGCARPTVTARSVAPVADANFRVVNRRARFDNGVDVFHRRRMVNQHVKGGIGVPKIFDNQRLSLGLGTLNVVTFLCICMIFGTPSAHLTRRQCYMRYSMFFQSIYSGGQGLNLRPNLACP